MTPLIITKTQIFAKVLPLALLWLYLASCVLIAQPAAGVVMLLFKIERRSSSISGTGVFAQEPIPRRAMVMAAPTIMGKVMTSEATAVKLFALSENAGADHFLKVFHRTCVRIIGDHFSFNDQLLDTDYLNHSFTPNLLFAFGHCLALQPIAAGDELTIDYSLLLPTGESIGCDESTGRPIMGLSGVDAARAVCQSLVHLFGPDAL